jgi:hypothetical protein
MRTGKNAEPNVLAALDLNLDQRRGCEISPFAGCQPCLGAPACSMPGSHIAIYI